jgi:hypothetical protein
VQKREMVDVEKWRVKGLMRRGKAEKIIRDIKIARIQEKQNIFKGYDASKPLRHSIDMDKTAMREMMEKKERRRRTEMAFRFQAERQPAYSMQARATGENLHEQTVNAARSLMVIQHALTKKDWSFTKNKRLINWLERWTPFIERGGKELIIAYLKSKGAHEEKPLGMSARQFMYDPRSTYDLAQKIPENKK